MAVTSVQDFVKVEAGLVEVPTRLSLAVHLAAV